VILLHGLFSRAEKILLIAFDAANLAGADFEKFETERLHVFAHASNRFFPQPFALTNPAGANLLAPQFELRLD